MAIEMKKYEILGSHYKPNNSTVYGICVPRNNDFQVEEMLHGQLKKVGQKFSVLEISQTVDNGRENLCVFAIDKFHKSGALAELLKAGKTLQTPYSSLVGQRPIHSLFLRPQLDSSAASRKSPTEITYEQVLRGNVYETTKTLGALVGAGIGTLIGAWLGGKGILILAAMGGGACFGAVAGLCVSSFVSMCSDGREELNQIEHAMQAYI